MPAMTFVEAIWTYVSIASRLVAFLLQAAGKPPFITMFLILLAFLLSGWNPFGTESYLLLLLKSARNTRTAQVEALDATEIPQRRLDTLQRVALQENSLQSKLLRGTMDKVIAAREELETLRSDWLRQQLLLGDILARFNPTLVSLLRGSSVASQAPSITAESLPQLIDEIVVQWQLRQPVSQDEDEAVKTDYEELQASIDKLTSRIMKNVANSHHLRKLSDSAALVKDSSKSYWSQPHQSHLLRGAIWSFLLRTIFSNPFAVFGRRAHHLAAEWQSPEVDRLTEVWRSSTAQALAEVAGFVMRHETPQTSSTLPNRKVLGRQQLNDALKYRRLADSGFSDDDQNRLSPICDIEASNAVYQAHALLVENLWRVLDQEYLEDKESLIQWAIEDVVTQSEILALRIACQSSRFEMSHPMIGVVVDEQDSSDDNPKWVQIPQLCQNVSKGRIAFISRPGLQKRSVEDLSSAQNKIDLFPAYVFLEETDDPTSVETEQPTSRPIKVPRRRRPPPISSDTAPAEGTEPTDADLPPTRYGMYRRGRGRGRPAPIGTNGPAPGRESFQCSTCHHTLLWASNKPDIPELRTPLTATFPSSSSENQAAPPLCEACKLKAAPRLRVFKSASNRTIIQPISPDGMAVVRTSLGGIQIIPTPDSGEVDIQFAVSAAYNGVRVYRMEDEYGRGIEVRAVAPEDELWEIPVGPFWKSPNISRYKLITESLRIGLARILHTAGNELDHFLDDGYGYSEYFHRVRFQTNERQTYESSEEEQEGEEREREIREAQEQHDHQAREGAHAPEENEPLPKKEEEEQKRNTSFQNSKFGNYRPPTVESDPTDDHAPQSNSTQAPPTNNNQNPVDTVKQDPQSNDDHQPTMKNDNERPDTTKDQSPHTNPDQGQTRTINKVQKSTLKSGDGKRNLYSYLVHGFDDEL
ncbi:hypothetical protein K491DRAFT_681159 [Lophiostoma macrostomum CBS 122681]|uniref:Uncharacterized protein n=1 Tax=Lophiostoma macrostomum CBS 122681 TaxID=1314788 RepID=A0A6A6T1F1_9PLEO|nr:hypothetical protein K491DRAFT_681159 [Lophiostoma macrostomum CBS 122681]